MLIRQLVSIRSRREKNGRASRHVARRYTALLAGLLCVALLPTADALAQADVPDRVEGFRLTVKNPEWNQGRVRFQPDPLVTGGLERAGTARLDDFPLPGGAWVDLELVSSSVLHGGTRYFVSDADGIHETSPPAMRFFRGRVVGEAGSLVSLTLFEGKMAGFVRTGGSEYTFGPTAGSESGTDGNLVEVRDDATDSDPPGFCDGHLESPTGVTVSGTAQASEPDISMGASSMGAGIDSNTLLLAHVAVEGTVEWVNHHGGVAGAQAYSLNLMAQVSAIYEADFKVQLQVPYVLMHTAEPDGYSGGSNSTSTMLDEMVDNWNASATLRDVFRTTAHLFSTYPSGGSGRAYVNVLCDGVPANSNARDFGVSLLSGNGGPWERGLVAHELGHNFASPHTHCYDPEIDQCYGSQSGCYSGPDLPTTGTIMSYCNSSLDTFHTRVIDEKLRPAAEAAYPACMDVAGMPGQVRVQDGAGLAITGANICASETCQDDDGNTNGAYGYSGSAQASWVKRFTPSCYPFKLDAIDVVFSSSSTVSPGRPMRVLVYTDAAGTGNPVNATLAHSEDTTVQVVGSSQWNSYSLSSPVVIASGDLYLGFHDLDPDAGTTYIMDRDSSRSGDSWWQANSTQAGGFGSFSNGTWMIRGHGGGVSPSSLSLGWGQPCNDTEVPNQDFAVYQGTIGDWTNLTAVTCTTGHDGTWLTETAESNIFWLVVPQNSANEGSYGRSSAGERAPAAVPCKPQALAVCP